MTDGGYTQTEAWNLQLEAEVTRLRAENERLREAYAATATMMTRVEINGAEYFVHANVAHEIARLSALLARAAEELRMIRMKDSNAVYDILLRTDLCAALSPTPADGGKHG